MSAVILFYLFSLLLMSMPRRWGHWTDDLSAPFKPVWNVLGLWHYFPLFSPNPARRSSSFYALITFADGSVREWPLHKTWDVPDLDRLYLRYASLYFLEWPRIRSDEAFVLYGRYILRQLRSDKTAVKSITFFEDTAEMKPWAVIPIKTRRPRFVYDATADSAP